MIYYTWFAITLMTSLLGNKLKVLVIEDDLQLSLVLQKELLFWGYRTLACSNGNAGLDIIKKNHIDLIIVDFILPDIDGISVIKSFREVNNKVPMILMTSLEDNDTVKFKAYKFQANLFHTKPVDFELLKVQIDMLLNDKKRNKSYRLYNLEVSEAGNIVKKAGKAIKMSKNEFKLLSYFIREPEIIFSRNDIINLLKMKQFEAESASVDTLISRIRKKIGKIDNYDLIETVYGIGYKLNHALVEQLESL